LGIGDWGLGLGPNPQSPIPNPQSPILYFFHFKKNTSEDLKDYSKLLTEKTLPIRN